MFLNILLMATAIIGFYLSIRTNKLLPILITLGLATGILLTLFPVKEIKIPGIYFYMGALIGVFIYGFTSKSKSIVAKFILLLMPASMFTFWLWTENHWNGDTSLALWFTLVLSGLSLFYKKELRKEWGMLIIISMDAITLIIENLLKQFS